MNFGMGRWIPSACQTFARNVRASREADNYWELNISLISAR